MRMLRRLHFALLVVGLMAAWTVRTWAADTDKFLPGTSNVVVTVNVKQLLDSALIKKFDDKIKDGIKGNAEAKKVLEQLGLDPFKDIDKLVIAGGGAKQDDVLMVVSGRFDRKKIESTAADAAKGGKDIKILTEGQYTVYQMEGKDGTPGFAALLNENTIVLGPKKDYVLEALDKQAGTKKADLKKDLTALLDKADGKLSISVVALAQGLGGAQAQDLADKIKNVTGGITVTDEIKMVFELAAKDDKGAKELAGVIDEQVGQAKAFVGLMAAQDKKLAPLVDIIGTVKVAAQGSSVNLKGEVNKDVLDKLLKLLPK